MAKDCLQQDGKSEPKTSQYRTQVKNAPNTAGTKCWNPPMGGLEAPVVNINSFNSSSPLISSNVQSIRSNSKCIPPKTNGLHSTTPFGIAQDPVLLRSRQGSSLHPNHQIQLSSEEKNKQIPKIFLNFSNRKNVDLHKESIVQTSIFIFLLQEADTGLRRENKLNCKASRMP